MQVVCFIVFKSRKHFLLKRSSEIAADFVTIYSPLCTVLGEPMNMSGYGEIRTVHDWESFLQWQEEHILIKGSAVVCKFSSEYIIALSNCKTPTTALIEAFNLARYLRDNEPDAHAQYVARHFIDLIRRPLKLPHDLSQMFEELYQALFVTSQEKQHGKESQSPSA